MQTRISAGERATVGERAGVTESDRPAKFPLRRIVSPSRPMHAAEGRGPRAGPALVGTRGERGFDPRDIGLRGRRTTKIEHADDVVTSLARRLQRKRLLHIRRPPLRLLRAVSLRY